MAKPGLDFGSILRAWQVAGGLNDAEAAAALSTGVGTYKGWKAANYRAVGTASQSKVLRGLGARTYLDAKRKYASPDQGEACLVHANYEAESENVLLSYFETAREVRETFVMRTSYRAMKSGYRRQLEAFVQERLASGKLTMLRVEQFQLFDRLIDVLVNIRRFDPLKYCVKVITRADYWFPAVNFTIFDKRAVVAGGFHYGSPSREPFLEYFGSAYSNFYPRVWERTWDYAAIEFSMLNDIERDQLALVHARAIPGHDQISMAELRASVDERESLINEFPTRY